MGYKKVTILPLLFSDKKNTYTRNTNLYFGIYGLVKRDNVFKLLPCIGSAMNERGE